MNRPEITLILARAANGVIGAGGKMAWHLPADLRRFKQLTMGRPMIMGRKTFDSLPAILEGRRHIVVTRDPEWQDEGAEPVGRSAEHTSELQSLMRISYAVFCLKKKQNNNKHNKTTTPEQPTETAKQNCTHNH